MNFIGLPDMVTRLYALLRVPAAEATRTNSAYPRSLMVNNLNSAYNSMTAIAARCGRRELLSYYNCEVNTTTRILDKRVTPGMGMLVGVTKRSENDPGGPLRDEFVAIQAAVQDGKTYTGSYHYKVLGDGRVYIDEKGGTGGSSSVYWRLWFLRTPGDLTAGSIPESVETDSMVLTTSPTYGETSMVDEAYKDDILFCYGGTGNIKGALARISAYAGTTRTATLVSYANNAGNGWFEAPDDGGNLYSLVPWFAANHTDLMIFLALELFTQSPHHMKYQKHTAQLMESYLQWVHADDDTSAKNVINSGGIEWNNPFGGAWIPGQPVGFSNIW